MNHTDLQKVIADLEKSASAKKKSLEEGFSVFSDSLKPANIAKRSLKLVLFKTKVGFSKLIQKLRH
jgi:hypothetical protein